MYRGISTPKSSNNISLRDKKILVVGASSDMAAELNRSLCEAGPVIGLHYNANPAALVKFTENGAIRKFRKDLKNAKACRELVDGFAKWAKGIDCLVQVSGGINRPIHWSGLTSKDWVRDLNINLIMPFFLSQRAVTYMKDKGGRIVLMSTASACHGGGATSLAYGVAKAGIECMVKGLARDCAKYNILVNAIAPGFILTKFHTDKMRRTKEQLDERVKMIPLKRAGTGREFADLVMFLLSDSSSYITGQTIALSGGDWL